MSDIRAAQSHVQRTLRYTPDGPVDTWGARNGFGDCEDFALAKREYLIQRSASPRDLRIVMGWDRVGARHAVLFARDTEDKWWVLDNQYTDPVPAGRNRMRYDTGIWGDPR